MELLEFIAKEEFDFDLSYGFPASKSIIMNSLKIDEQTYQKEIRKLKKEGLIQSTYVRYEEDNIYHWGWFTTEKARELPNIKKIRNELNQRWNESLEMIGG
jgi:DNA-binding Lrp family transcriptional regulator